MDMTERDTQLSNLARASELHSTRKLSPTQIRQRAGFLDSNEQPYIPLETIQNWLDGAAARTPSQPAPAQPREADDTSALHTKIALLEAQLWHLRLAAPRVRIAPPWNPPGVRDVPDLPLRSRTTAGR
jgi:hypothetical protein